MALRTILVAASGGTASNGAVELACRLAKRLGAHLEGLHVRSDPREIIAMAGDGFGVAMPRDWIDEINKSAADLAEETKISFDAAIARHGLPSGAIPSGDAVSAAWRDETGYAPFMVSRYGRYFDLVVLGRSDRILERPYSESIEQTLLHSGRPVLLAPAQAPRVIGETIAVGWNGSSEAVRALTFSLPLLAAAHAVSIITVGDQEEPVTFVMDYLAWHGVVATHHAVQSVSGVGPGEQLLAAARDDGADLLVMGGYGHKPWRELLFGGATREIVGVSLLPLLLSH